ncbi:MAG: MATE family efflux transporter [Clostridia bacterium]|jgi:putative MATE family efflux protein|nr:MATE family efflux transporter [Clostridia bacterium]
MKIQLSDSFNFRRLLRYSFPSILMMICTSIYTVVDGFFVSNFVGKNALAAVNFIFPFIMILGAVGFMFGTGGGALIAKTLGEGDREKANRLFSLFVYVTIGCGAVLAAVGVLTVRYVAVGLGATEAILDDCVLYGRILLYALPAYMLQLEFQSYCATAEKPKLGLIVTVGAGITNVALDALFVVGFRWGLAGAAAATALSQAVGGIVPLAYFFCARKSLLRLGKTRFDGKSLWRACANGSSELLSNISMSMVAMLYNIQLMRYAGEDGVAAYGVLMYVNLVFLAAFIGYSVGTAPVIGYHYGAGNTDELKGLLKKSLVIIGIFSVAMVGLAEGLARPLALLFVGYDEALLALTVRGFFYFSFSFLFAGLAIFGSAFFTALNNGLMSAIISFLRTLVFQIAAVFVLPLLFGIDGIWVSLVVAELFAALLAGILLLVNKKKYRY